MTDKEPRYPIATVARQTGLSPHVLRAWERRYGAVTPSRDSGGARLYTAADVARLRLLRGATDAGMGIGRATTLPAEELLALVRESEAAAPPERPRGADVSGPILAAIEAMDGGRIHALLVRAALALGARDFVHAAAVPVLREVGTMWERGVFSPAHEHLLSSQMRRVLAWLLESLPVPDSAPGLVATTPPGHAHELGAMLAAVVGATEGWRVTFLGPDLPARDAAAAARVTRASVVLLSVVGPAAEGELLAQVDALRQALPPEAALVLGGPGAGAHADALAAAGASWLPDLEALGSMLRAGRDG
jgi:MerR family transcriptional regulator, light-induced transcriptional regulator